MISEPVNSLTATSTQTTSQTDAATLPSDPPQPSETVGRTGADLPSNTTKIFIGASVGGGLLVLITLLFFTFISKRRRRRKQVLGNGTHKHSKNPGKEDVLGGNKYEPQELFTPTDKKSELPGKEFSVELPVQASQPYIEPAPVELPSNGAFAVESRGARHSQGLVRISELEAQQSPADSIQGDTLHTSWKATPQIIRKPVSRETPSVVNPNGHGHGARIQSPAQESTISEGSVHSWRSP